MFQLRSLLASVLALSLTTLAAPTTPNDDFQTPLPLIIWHGLGDNHAAAGLNEISSLASAIQPGLFTYNIRLASSPSEDQRATFLGNVTEQVAQVCADLASHPILSTAPAVDAIGFSQGGQFLRAYIERCNSPPVRSLITFGSQHNGISEFQACGSSDFLCRGSNQLLRSGTWSSFVQSRLVPAQYFRDPADLDTYLEHSNFLADINNERKLKNQTYKENLKKLENFVMYLFDEDVTVVPKETGWFAEVKDGEVTPLKERAIYKEDWLGLKELDEAGKLKFETIKGRHMALSDEVLNTTFEKYLGPEGKKFNHNTREEAEEL
jgi:palmitoyl-protein thioesterase